MLALEMRIDVHQPLDVSLQTNAGRVFSELYYPTAREAA